MTMKHLLVLFLLVVSSVASARTIVITDIDDTLKESHVLSTIGSVGNAFRHDAFWAMPELMRVLAAKPEVKVFYVSNAPEWVMGASHRKFLSKNGFPPGELHLRRDNGKEDHKRLAIAAILNRERPDQVILLGDNGERDAEIYSGIAAGVGTGVVFHTFIRHSYSAKTGARPLQARQIPFVTAGEIAVHLLLRGLVTPGETRALINLSYRRPGADWDRKESRHRGASLGFPDWFDCRDLRAIFPRLPGLQSEALLLEAKIRVRCSYVIDELEMVSSH